MWISMEMAELCLLCEQNLLNHGTSILFRTLAPVLRYASSDSHPDFKPLLLLWCLKSTMLKTNQTAKKNAKPPETYLCYFTVSKSPSTLRADWAAAKPQHTAEHWASRAYLKAIGQCPHGLKGGPRLLFKNLKTKHKLLSTHYLKNTVKYSFV